jgi:hypothetical protein
MTPFRISGDADPTGGAIDVAFDSAWRVLAARERPSRFSNDCELRAELGQRLTALASDGVRDAHELRRLVLASFPPI